jgi:rubrerythrin
LSSDYPIDINDVEVTDAELADLEQACELEITNFTFYKALGEKGNRNELLPSAFRALGRVEEEHLSDFSKLMQKPAPTEPKNPLPINPDWGMNIEQSKVDEIKASAFYAEAAARATTPRVKQVFTALSEVEADHIEIDDYLASVAR